MHSLTYGVVAPCLSDGVFLNDVDLYLKRVVFFSIAWCPEYNHLNVSTFLGPTRRLANQLLALGQLWKQCYC